MDGLLVKYRHHEVFTRFFFWYFMVIYSCTFFFAFFSFLFFFYLNQKGLKLGKEIEHGGRKDTKTLIYL